MIRILFPLTLMLLGSSLAATNQEKVNWLQQNAVPVRTLDIKDADFRDLAPLRETLKGVRVLLLGEQSHGDGTTFQAKARLIRYLHEQLGFTVLAFESGFVDLNRDQERIQAGGMPSQLLKNSLQAVWGESQQVAPLLSYLDQQARTGQPLIVAGVDLMPTNARRLPEHGADLKKRIETALTATPNVVQDAIPFLDTITALGKNPAEVIKKPVEQQRLVLAGADELVAMLREGPRRDRVLAQEIRNWRTYLAFMWSLPADFNATTMPPAAVMNMRDRMMGENALFLAREQFPGQKIIIWAANSHSAKRLDHLQGDIDRGQVPMGAYLHRALGSAAYTLGFTAVQGQFGNARPGAERTTLEKPVLNSFEELFSRTKLVNAFLNLRRQDTPWLSEPMQARPFGYVWSEGDWTKTVDGLFFTRNMEPSTPREK